MTKSKSDCELNDPRVITGWTMFDWANSAFALTIAVAIFPAYFEGVTAHVINPLGIKMYNTTLFSLTVAVAYLLIAFVSPILSGIADSGGRRQVFLKFFTTLGAVACLSLFIFDGVEMTDGPMLALGVLGFLIGTMGFAGSLVFFNSYLPDIVTEDLYNRVSAKGFMIGYVGSVILLIVNLPVITFPTTLIGSLNHLFGALPIVGPPRIMSAPRNSWSDPTRSNAPTASCPIPVERKTPVKYYSERYAGVADRFLLARGRLSQKRDTYFANPSWF